VIDQSATGAVRAPRASRPGRAATSLAWTVATCTALLPLTGCYHYAPVVERSAVAPPTVVALRVTDAGRVALAPRFGEGVRAIEGRLEARPDTAYRLAVTAVQYIDGRVDRWSGEPVTVSAATVGVVETRQLSRGRTWVAAATAVAVVVLFIATRSLGVFGGVGTQQPGQPGGPQQS
jgi:hypothetical protein